MVCCGMAGGGVLALRHPGRFRAHLPERHPRLPPAMVEGVYLWAFSILSPFDIPGSTGRMASTLPPVHPTWECPSAPSEGGELPAGLWRSQTRFGVHAVRCLQWLWKLDLAASPQRRHQRQHHGNDPQADERRKGTKAQRNDQFDSQGRGALLRVPLGGAPQLR